MKILMIMSSKFQQSGITTVVVNYYRELVKNDDCKIDLLVPNYVGKEYEKEFYNNDSKIFQISIKIRQKRPILYIYRCKKIIESGNYDIVHVHGSSSIMSLELFAAKLAKVKVRIAHSHNTVTEHIIIHRLLNCFFQHLYTHAFACSYEAGIWLFKNRNFTIINNGFSINKFKYDELMRKKIRNQLNINDDQFLIGHVGLFNDQKNQTFLVSVFNDILKEYPNTKLIFIGGDRDNKKNDVIEYSKQLGCYDKIIFYGSINDVSKMYSAMDCFAFPSKYEGLGIVAIEAQISGLCCVFSKFLPKAVILNDDVSVYNINENDTIRWKNQIINYCRKKNDRNKCYYDNLNKFKEYEISSCAAYLYSIYKKII